MGAHDGSPPAAARRTGRLAALALAMAVPAVVVPTAASAAEVAAAPVVTNTVSATYDVDYAWQVFNAVDRNRAEAPAGGTATVRYAVGVTALGPPSRSGFEVAGTLGVTNPGAQGLSVSLVADLAGSAGCLIAATDESPAAGLQVTVPPGPSSFAYACSPGSAPTGPATTTVTVSWDAGPGQGAGSSNAVAQSSFVVDQSSDERTTVSSAADGTAPTILGTFDWDDVWAAPDHRVLVTVSSLTLGVGDGPCAHNSNVARETADATTDSEIVTVCAKSSGRADGRLRTTCRGTVRAHLVNRSSRMAVYRLRVGSRMHRFWVRPVHTKTIVARGDARAVVTLRAGAAQLERTRVPQRCRS